MDITILLWLQEIRTSMWPWIENIAALLSDLLSHLSVVIPFLVYWTVSRKKGQKLLGILALSFFLNQFVKSSFCVYRPWVRDARIVPSSAAVTNATGYSFPSGHSQSSAAGYGGLAYEFKENRKLVSAMLVIIFLAGFLRLFLSVHTPQDVLCGLALGALSIFLVQKIFAWLSKGNRSTMFLTAGLLVCAAGIAYALLKEYPMDYVSGELIADPAEMLKDAMASIGLSAGIILGGYLENRYVHFADAETNRQRIIRILTGSAGIGIIYLCVKFLMKPYVDPSIYNFTKAFLPILFAVYVFPLLLKKYEKNVQL